MAEWIMKEDEDKDGVSCYINKGELIRCKDCKHRILNKNYGKKGYIRIKAMCELDTGDPFELGKNAEDDDWYCADAERKEADGSNKD